jgi:hypothetical protein
VVRNVPACTTCLGKRRVLIAKLRPEWSSLASVIELAKETSPLPPFPGSGDSMYDFTETDCPACTGLDPDLAALEELLKERAQWDLALEEPVSLEQPYLEIVLSQVPRLVQRLRKAQARIAHLESAMRKRIALGYDPYAHHNVLEAALEGLDERP